MSNTRNDWFKQPTRTQVVVVAAVWAAGMLLQVASLTNFFTQPLATKSHAAMWLILWLPATITLVQLLANYLRNRRQQTM